MTKKQNNSDIIYESFKKWSEKNWKDTIEKHSKEIEEFFMKLNSLDIWSNLLQDIDSNRNLIPELFLDSYMGLIFACQGLYKYAFICLRSQLEITLRVIYFSNHPIEYGWWLEGRRWYLKKGMDVWGEEFNYFRRLKSISDFNSELPNENNNIINDIQNSYKRLSKYVHGSPHTFQSKDSMISPFYSIEAFKFWMSKSIEMLEYINLLFILGFEDKFHTLPDQQKNKIFDFIKSSRYNEAISKIYGKTNMDTTKKNN